MSEHTLGDAPIEPQYVEDMQRIAHILNDVFNKDLEITKRKTGFVLLVFPFGNDFDGRANFISNGANRKDIVVLFKEMIARMEGQPEIEGHA
jgi:hypothetical protein